MPRSVHHSVKAIAVSSGLLSKRSPRGLPCSSNQLLHHPENPQTRDRVHDLDTDELAIAFVDQIERLQGSAALKVVQRIYRIFDFGSVALELVLKQQAAASCFAGLSSVSN